MNKWCVVILLMLLCVGNASAQRRSSKAKKVEVKTPEQQLYDELLHSTAKIMFIDSVVVDKEDFLSHLPLPKDVGCVTREGDQMVYVNEFDDTRILASGDSLSRHLYISHRYGPEWDSPRCLDELDNLMPDYPFLMADGITLYFSAEGEGTVGGRDLFLTAYDTSDSQFYEATNVGLPFNSPQNDYMLAISDIDNLGWLVTDRHQEEGQVCIYTFEPTAQRQTFAEDVPTADIKQYAEISSIKDTWGFGDYASAIKRRDELMKRMAENTNAHSIEFVVNDDTVYRSLDDFSSKSNRAQYEEILQAKERLSQLTRLLENLRTSYTEASPSKRREIGRNIASMETEIDTLADEIHSSEKDLRKKENQ